MFKKVGSARNDASPFEFGMTRMKFLSLGRAVPKPSLHGPPKFKKNN